MGWKPHVFEMLDRRYFVKRLVLSLLLVVASYLMWWFTHFAETSKLSGMEIAAIITAINAPFTLLIGALAAFWKEIDQPKTGGPK